MIEIKNFNKKFNKKIIFDNVNINFPKNEISIILGKNGAGKTTLLKSIMKLIKYEGIIEIDNKDFFSIYKDIFAVYYDFCLYENLTGYQNLKIILSDKKFNIEKLLSFNILNKKKINDKVKNYSYGEKKKLYLLGILVMKPKILLFDEITNGMDFSTLELFKNFLVETNATIIIASHNYSFFNSLVDNVYCINNKKIEKIIFNEKKGDELLNVYRNII